MKISATINRLVDKQDSSVKAFASVTMDVHNNGKCYHVPGVNYEIKRIDMFEGYKEDLVFYCKVRS